MIAKPKRIVAPPVPAKTLRGVEPMILCDNGIWYLLRDLARAIQVSPEAMRARLARMHWSHPEILAPNKFKAFQPTQRATAPVSKKTTSLNALGDKARDHKLARIGGPGLLERSR